MVQNSNASNIKVGITIFVGLIILFVFIILIGTNDFIFSKTFSLYVNLDNTAGLVDGAPVTLGGFKIGDVEKVEFIVVNNKSTIRVKLRIKSEFKEQLRKDSKVRVTSIGILGDKFIDVSICNPSSPQVEENTFLVVEPTLSLDNIAKNVSPSLTSLNNVMHNLEVITDSLSKGRGTVASLINNSNTIDNLISSLIKINNLLSSLENKNGTLQKLLNDDSLYNDIAASTKELKTITAKLNNGQGSVGKLLNNDSLYNNLNEASFRLKHLFAKADSDSSLVNSLLSDKKLFANINRMITELNNLLADIKEHPERYVNVSLF